MVVAYSAVFPSIFNSDMGFFPRVLLVKSIHIGLEVGQLVNLDQVQCEHEMYELGPFTI